MPGGRSALEVWREALRARQERSRRRGAGTRRGRVRHRRHARRPSVATAPAAVGPRPSQASSLEGDRDGAAHHPDHGHGLPARPASARPPDPWSPPARRGGCPRHRDPVEQGDRVHLPRPPVAEPAGVDPRADVDDPLYPAHEPGLLLELAHDGRPRGARRSRCRRRGASTNPATARREPGDNRGCARHRDRRHRRRRARAERCRRRPRVRHRVPTRASCRAVSRLCGTTEPRSTRPDAAVRARRGAARSRSPEGRGVDGGPDRPTGEETGRLP